MGKLDIAWIRGSNALSIFKDRINPRLVNNKRKLTRASCSVFIPLCHKEGKLNLLFTKRADTLNSHTGQISFPGGRCDDGETAIETSVREMAEEIGIEPLEVWGCLSRPVVSLKLENVYGCVGYIGEVDDTEFILSEREVSHTFTVPIENLVNTRFEEIYDSQKSRIEWDKLATRVESDGYLSHEERLQAIRVMGDGDVYTMPQFPSSLSKDLDIWGLTAILTDRILYLAFKQEGYKKHTFVVDEFIQG